MLPSGEIRYPWLSPNVADIFGYQRRGDDGQRQGRAERRPLGRPQRPCRRHPRLGGGDEPLRRGVPRHHRRRRDALAARLVAAPAAAGRRRGLGRRLDRHLAVDAGRAPVPDGDGPRRGRHPHPGRAQRHRLGQRRRRAPVRLRPRRPARPRHELLEIPAQPKGRRLSGGRRLCFRRQPRGASAQSRGGRPFRSR